MAENDGIGGSGLPVGQYPNLDDLGEGSTKKGGFARIMLFTVIGAVGVIGAVLWYLMSGTDDTPAHAAFREEIFVPVHTKYYEGFWGCVLRDPVRSFKSGSEIRDKIKVFSFDRRTQAYAEFIKTEPKCLPLLDEAIPEYRGIVKNAKTPLGYAPALLELSSAMDRTKSAWVAYQEYQAQYRTRHDLLDRIDITSKAWVGYQSSTRNRVPEKVAHWQPNAMPYVRYIKCLLGDTSFTSFEGGAPGEAVAQQKLLDTLDAQCDSNRAAFLVRLEDTCKQELVRNTLPEEVDELNKLADHWNKIDNDFGSAIPIKECLEGYEETHVGMLLDNISKAWNDYVSAYNKLVELNNTFLGKRTETKTKGRGAKKSSPYAPPGS